LNHGDTDDTEIVSGDEDNLTPIEDIPMEANSGLTVEQMGESAVQDSQPSEVVDQSATFAPEHEMADEQQPVETHSDWQSPVAEQPVIPVETISEVSEPEKVKPQPNGWQQIRNFFFGGSAGDAARLSNLTQSIEDAPESAVNYILRAELYMGLREYALAQTDFQRAVELADTQFELADWGVLDQVMRDRALTGLDKVQRRLR